MRMDFVFIGLLLVISAIYSYFKGYIENGIGLIMTASGAYIAATGFFFKYEKKGLPNRPPKNG